MVLSKLMSFCIVSMLALSCSNANFDTSVKSKDLAAKPTAPTADAEPTKVETKEPAAPVVAPPISPTNEIIEIKGVQSTVAIVEQLDLKVTTAVGILREGNQTTQAVATFKFKAGEPDVIWSIKEPTGVASIGTISNTGLYSTPVSVTVPFFVTITATLKSDPSMTASAIVQVLPVEVVPVPMILASAPVTKLQAGSAAIVATVKYVDGFSTGNPSVTWSIKSVSGTTADVIGSITQAGQYLPPATATQNVVVTIEAVLKNNPSVKSSVSLTVVPKPELIVAAAGDAVKTGATLQATATFKAGTGTGAPDVTWSIAVAKGAASDKGKVSTAGLYTAPATTAAEFVIRITATLKSDPTVTAFVDVRVISSEIIFAACTDTRPSTSLPIFAKLYDLIDHNPLEGYDQVSYSSLPTDYNDAYQAKYRSNICMSNYSVPVREFKMGFPGLASDVIEHFALRTSTYLKIETAGVYEFELDSDDGSIMRIDGVKVIDMNRLKESFAASGRPEDKGSYRATLAAGRHALEIDYFQGPKFSISLELKWKKPGMTTFEYIPTSSLSPVP